MKKKLREPKAEPALSPGDRVEVTNGEYKGLIGLVKGVSASKDGLEVSIKLNGMKLTMSIEDVVLKEAAHVANEGPGIAEGSSDDSDDSADA